MYHIKIYPHQVEVFALCFLLIHYYFKHLNFRGYNFTERSVIDSIINVIGPQQEQPYSTENINLVIDFFKNSIDTVEKKINKYEFYIALITMKNSGFLNWRPLSK
jgi:hypothetical protein